MFLFRVSPLVKRLATGDWFTHRLAAAALVASVYPQVVLCLGIFCRVVCVCVVSYLSLCSVFLNGNGVLCVVLVARPAQASPPMQDELRALFVVMCRDETPMVRRGACSHMAAVSAVVTHAAAVTDLVPAWVALAQDEQVRHVPE